ESAGTDTATIKDVTILGDTDPNAYSIDSDPFNERAQQQIPERCERLGQRFLEIRPHILMTHDPRMGECAAQLAERDDIPLVFVWGHLHRQSYEQRGSVVSLSPGTSGANGIKTGSPAPYGFSIIEF